MNKKSQDDLASNPKPCDGEFPSMSLDLSASADRAELPTTEPKSQPNSPSVSGYRIVRKLGQGGMGVVYEAVHESLNRRVALKLLPNQFSDNEIAVERFLREARSAAALHHTNIVPVFDVGSSEDSHYYAMQLIEGLPLSDVIKAVRRSRSSHSSPPKSGSSELADQITRDLTLDETPAQLTQAPPDSLKDGETVVRPIDAMPPSLPIEDDFSIEQGTETKWSSTPTKTNSSTVSDKSDRKRYHLRVAKLGAQVADALSYAHSRGIIHRDIKPANLMLDRTGNVWITDFGLAKTEDDGLTRTGGVVGTLRYMSPERFKGQCDFHCDLYALGISLYELLSLNHAFSASDQASLLQQIQDDEPKGLRLHDSTIPKDLETIIHKTIQKEPAKRYASASDMADDLNRFVNGQPILARKVSWLEKSFLWARKNKAIATLSAILLATLILGFATSLSLGILASRRAEKAEQEATIALEQTQVALATLRSVIYNVQVKLKDIPEAREVRRSLLLDTVADIQKVSNSYVDQLSVSRDSAKALNDLAELILEIGDETGADLRTVNERFHSNAVKNYLELIAADPTNVELLMEAYDSIMEYGNNAREFREFDLAIETHGHTRRIAGLAMEHATTEKEKRIAMLYRASSTEAYAEAMIRTPQINDAKVHVEDAVKYTEAYNRRYPKFKDGYDALALAYSTAGDYHRILKNFDEAEKALLAMRAASIKIIELDPEEPDKHDIFSSDFERLGDLEYARKDYNKAHEYYQKMLWHSEQYMAEDPENLFRMKQSTWAYQKLARLYETLGEDEKAAQANAKLKSIQTKLDLEPTELTN